MKKRDLQTQFWDKPIALDRVNAPPAEPAPAQMPRFHVLMYRRGERRAYQTIQIGTAKGARELMQKLIEQNPAAIIQRFDTRAGGRWPRHQLNPDADGPTWLEATSPDADTPGEHS